MGVKNPQKITPDLKKKIFDVANREEVKDLSNKEIADIVNKEYLEETGKTSNVKEASVRRHGGVKKGSGNKKGSTIYSMDQVRANLIAHGKSLEGTDSELRRRSSNATAAAKVSDRTEIGAFLSNRARKSKVPKIQETATRLLNLYRSDPTYPSTQAHLDEIDSLRLGSGFREVSGRVPGTEAGRTFTETAQGGPVPEALKEFQKHRDIVNSKANDLLNLKIITPEKNYNLRVSGGHAFAKSDQLWPQLRNAPSNAYLQPLSENLAAQAEATPKDIYEYLRINEGMSRDGHRVGTSKGGLRNMYAINDILKSNNLEQIPEETIKYFQGLPSIRSWKSSGDSIVGKQGNVKGDVSGVIKKTLLNLLDTDAARLAIKSGKYALRGAGIAGIPLSAKASVDYQREGHPYLSTVAGLSTVPVLSIPMLAAEAIGNIWNRDKELQRKREEERGLLNYVPPKRYRAFGGLRD